MITNFTTLFEDELTGQEVCGLDYCSLDVEYQSPYTVVLEGKIYVVIVEQASHSHIFCTN